jgi:hypothetical protein
VFRSVMDDHRMLLLSTLLFVSRSFKRLPPVV